MMRAHRSYGTQSGANTVSEKHFAKVSSQQNQQLNSEASKIPAGSGPAIDSTEDMASSKDVDKEASKKSKVPKRPEAQNGGSLEDCFSNVYQFLELPGIKWKCFRTRPSAPRDVPLTTDLVIRAYSKCILDGILCAWRRKQLPPTGDNEILPLPSFSNDTPRELWVFWYDENEPAALKKHCEGLEVDEEASSAAQMNIVSYEVRTILFKALHIFLERDLTKDGYVRFGKWFTIPREPREAYQHSLYPTYTPALRINFFVHGGNTVCVSIQGQKQPTLLNLHRRHVEYKKSQDPKGLEVIVGPWSLRGRLMRDQSRLWDDPKFQAAMEKEWNHWKEYLQMEVKEPEKVPDSERLRSPEPEPTPAPYRSLLTDSSDEDASSTVEDPDERAFEMAPPHLKWMNLDWRTEKSKELSSEEKENREKARKVRKERREKRKERHERKKEAEKKRSEAMEPGEYDSDVVTEPDTDEEKTEDTELPKMVFVDIDGVRMLYPTKFICVTLEDDRTVLDAKGQKTHPMPEELQARRPRNRFVVGASNPILPLEAVWQYCQMERDPLKQTPRIERTEEHGFERGLSSAPLSDLVWKSSSQSELCKCVYKKNDAAKMNAKIRKFIEKAPMRKRNRLTQIWSNVLNIKEVNVRIRCADCTIKEEKRKAEEERKRREEALKAQELREKKREEEERKKKEREEEARKEKERMEKERKEEDGKADDSKTEDSKEEESNAEGPKEKDTKAENRKKEDRKKEDRKGKDPDKDSSKDESSAIVLPNQMVPAKLFESLTLQPGKRKRTLPPVNYQEMQQTVINRIHRKNDFAAYHKKTAAKQVKLFKSKEKKRRWRRKQLLAMEKEEEEQDKERAEGLCRSNPEEDAYQVDRLCQEDWLNFDEEDPRGIPDLESTKEVFNEIQLERPPPDDTYNPRPFLPMTFFAKKPINGDFEMRPGDDDPSEERFNELYHDNAGKWTADMTRSEKIEVASYEFDPMNRPPPSPRPYHLTEMPKRSQYVPYFPTPKSNPLFTGPLVVGGLKAYGEVLKAQDRKTAGAYAKKIAKIRRETIHRAIQNARKNRKKLKELLKIRTVGRAVRQLKKILKKDHRSKGTKQMKFSELTPKKKEEVRIQRTHQQRRKLGLIPQRKVKIEDALGQLNMNIVCSDYEKAGPFGECETDGYILANCADALSSHSEEESDSEEQRSGLGEGTSTQSPAEETPVGDVDAVDHVVEMTTIVGSARTAAEHVGPDGLLSPPASNEMPKGGPLSVGPPSIEAQGLNQIYPTPPSVQMLQGESTQVHSPLMHGKTVKLPPVPEEEIERIAVPGGVATIEEIKVEDLETANMQKWNKKVSQSKLSKFLVASSEDPILAGRKKKYSTPCSDKFTAVKTPKKVSSKMVYKSMVTTKFDCAPNHAFGELVRARIHEKRMTAIAIAAAATAAAVPPSVKQSPMLPNPMFASPALPSHTPSPSVGPMGHHPMGPAAYPPPSPFNAPPTPTYPGMVARPGSNFGSGPGFPYQMMPPGHPMGQRVGPPQQMLPQQMLPQQHQHMHMLMQQQRMQQQIMHNRQMAGQGTSHNFGYPQGPGTPSPFPHNGPSGMQQLNNFVNQTRFGPNGQQPPQYGMPQAMVPQSPNFNQPYGMMNPAQQQQLQQQQMQQQQMQHFQQMQLQRNQMQLQQHQMNMQQMQPLQPLQPPQPPPKPTKHQLQMERQEVWFKTLEKLKMENPRQYERFQLRQAQLEAHVMPTSLQPLCLLKLRYPPDPNIPLRRQLVSPLPPPEIDVPEGDSLTIAIILSDSILDLHFDSVFDSCPICSCSVSIRSRDLGMYIAPHEFLRTNRSGYAGYREYSTGIWSGFHVSAPTNCTCGFSSIRHRYLSCYSGLFPEDANEATAQTQCVAKVIPHLPLPRRGHMTWFDSKSAHDLALLDQIRHLSFSNSLGKAVSHMAATGEHADHLRIAAETGTDIMLPSEYLISPVDKFELLLLGNSAIDMCLKSGQRKPVSASEQTNQLLAYFHPWGLQTANEIDEMDVTEWMDMLCTLTPVLEGTAKQARQIPQEVVFQIEGPMTWKQIVNKSLRGRPPADDDEDFALSEPIPAVMRAAETGAIRTSPQVDQYYNQATLGPVDQPKDVMYITIIPDDDEIYKKTVAFMENLTKTYEGMHLGRHIPFPVSTGAATHIRELIKNQKQNPYVYTNEAYPGQHHFPPTLTQLLRTFSMKKVDNDDPTDEDPMVWEAAAAWKEERNKHMSEKCGEHYKTINLDQGIEETTFESPEVKSIWTTDRDEIPRSYYEREGIIRVGTPLAEITSNPKQLVTNNAEFMNMTRHLSDKEGYVSRLRMYMQQMEDLVTCSLSENRQAFERSGFRYQLAVEGRLTRKEKKKKVVEERMRYNAAKTFDERRADKAKPPEESELPQGVEIGSSLPEEWVDDEEEEKRLKKKKEDEQYPVEEPQAPSPIPAGMVHIPETLSVQERATQQTLEELLSEPCNVTPHNAASISWTQRDTSVPNPFPTSNQVPVPFEAIGTSDTDSAATLPHVIVIYVVNPFSYGHEGNSALHMRIALLSIIRTYNSIMSKLTPLLRSQVQLEIIGMESLESTAKATPDYFNDPTVPFDLLYDRPLRKERNSETGQVQIARSLSVAVYTHPRVLLPDVYKSVSARCMTAFGPGTQLLNTVNEINEMNMAAVLHAQHRSKALMNQMATFETYGYMPPLPPPLPREQTEIIAYRIPSNIVTLAPPPVVCQMEETGKPQLNSTDEQTLFIAYCLVGTDFLVATATDGHGRLVDNCVANIKPKRKHNETYRYRHNKTQILDGMGKLWSFILGIMASDIKNWRLVVGRLGRIGHGEFRAWTHLLNKTSLLRYSTSLKEICGACRSMPSLVGTPAILSACLISLEPEPSIRVFPDYYEQDAANKKNMLFTTPGDHSCTHILTFPVGAEINLEVQDQTGDQKAEDNWDINLDDIMEGLDDGDTEIMKDLGGIETPNSAAMRNTGGFSMFFSEDSSSIEIQNQPLAAGYYISTAAAPELPNWFWSSCPSAKRHNPVHLKSSLHINISEVKNDDIAMESTKDKEKEKDAEEKDPHPLESRQTEEVLRHVLESYNALSWLNMNRQTGERYSCLPIHVQHLLRLYHSVARLLV